VTFYGRGVDAESGTAALLFVPSTAIFEAQPVGRQSGAMTIEVRNLGPAALTPTAMVLNGPEVFDFVGYPVTCATGRAIPAGQSCLLTLFFDPQAAGTRRASLVIDSPQLAALAIMPIYGTGVPVGAPGVDPVPPGAIAIPVGTPAGLVILALALWAFGWRSLRRNDRAGSASRKGRS
jgi:hypothetical protein